MQKKIFGFIIILAGIALLAGIVYVFFASDYFFGPTGGVNGNSAVNNNENNETPKVVNINENQINSAQNKTNKDPREIMIGDFAENNIEAEEYQLGKKDLIRIAGSFSERFGTYSNQSNFGNISSLKIFMSLKMKKWSDNFIKEQKEKKYDTSIYYGITTKAVASEVKEFDDDLGIAGILVSTRRREATGTMNNYSNIFTQDILINFVMEDGAWKVDSVYWQE
ncbi:hypothetical protein KAU09_03250 [Candidatus Parcubacteria bacterium]|nr:hypothetical protein [Candidatus Parcubacteria bacterium]